MKKIICFLLFSPLSACGSYEGDSSRSDLDQWAEESAPLPDDQCEASLPPLDRNAHAKSEFKHGASKILALGQSPHHRGRDVLIREGEPVWALAKFTYGPFDQGIADEKIAVYFSMNCNGQWNQLGEGLTSDGHQHEPVYGVKDDRGRFSFNLSKANNGNLPLGRHKVAFVVLADQTMTSLYVNVVSREAHIVVTDVDGTLTNSEYAAVNQIISGAMPDSHPGAAALMKLFKEKNYYVYYLTARPEWLMDGTRQWLKNKGFPLGTINTTQSFFGANGSEAEKFKITELHQLRELTGIVPKYAFGNKSSDVSAFTRSDIAADRSYYFHLQGDPMGGHNHRNYNQLFDIIKKQL